jgi:hypothetical protein
MSFELPNLDVKTYQQLVVELMRRIPRYTKLWTDYNDSDPGITLLQLLAWLDESLLYQANQIPTVTDENFLRWVLGLAFSSNSTDYSLAAVTDYDLDFLGLQALLAQIEQGQAMTAQSLQKQVLLYLDSPYLALTLSNIVAIALQANRMIALEYQQQLQQQAASHSSAPLPVPLYVQQAYAQTAQQASTAYILSDAVWAYQYPAYPNQRQYANSSDTMRRLLLLQATDRSNDEQTLLRQVNFYLQPRVIAGNAVRVKAAQLTAIDLTLSIRCSAVSMLPVILDALVNLLFSYLLPAGGPDGQGWEYDQAPVADDLKHLVLSVPGVEALESFDYTYIPTIVLNQMAQLSANTLLADLPAGTAALQYRGLPQLRCLDITASNAASLP